MLDTDTGLFSVAGTPAIGKSWSDIAGHEAETTDVMLRAEIDFQPPGATFPFGVHLSVVEVDKDTGNVTISRHIACDDAGTMVNPLLVEGQVHGGVASGIAQALMEEFVYDEDGNPQTANLAEYALDLGCRTPDVRTDPARDADPAQSTRRQGHR